jgi:flagellar hook-basal body complex protein FliE
MDESFFVKYAIQIKKQKNSKEEVIIFIKEKTGIELQQEMITVSKKQISFQISSVVKQKLFQKDIVKILEEKGYSTRF